VQAEFSAILDSSAINASGVAKGGPGRAQTQPA